MACAIQLFDLLGGTPATGGQWTLGSTTNPAMTLTSIIDGVETTSAIDAIIGGSHSVSVDFGPSEDAEYVFTYTTGLGTSCQDEAELTVTAVDGVTAGSNAMVTLCQGENTDYTLWNFINGGDGIIGGAVTVTAPGTGINGLWTGDTTPPEDPSSLDYTSNTGGDPTDNTINPFNAPLGVYTYNYNVQVTGAVTCDTCQDTATVQITVSDAPSPGLDASATVCRNI